MLEWSLIKLAIQTARFNYIYVITFKKLIALKLKPCVAKYTVSLYKLLSKIENIHFCDNGNFMIIYTVKVIYNRISVKLNKFAYRNVISVWFGTVERPCPHRSTWYLSYLSMGTFGGRNVY